MKCPSCGGEVSSQSARCPYCGNVYEPGALFQREIAEKVARNKLLPKFILKSRTPDMVQMLLTRVVVGFGLAAFLITAAAFCIYMAGERVGQRTPRPDSYAQKYLSKYTAEDTAYIEDDLAREYRDEVMEAVNTGQEVKEYQVEAVLRNVCKVLRDETVGETAKEQIYAFLYGYLLLTEDEINRLQQAAENGMTDYTFLENTAAMIIQRLEEGR